MKSIGLAHRIMKVALLLALGAAACSQPASPSPAASKTAPSAATQGPGVQPTKPAETKAPSATTTKVRLGVVSSTSDSGFFIAMDKGYFQEQGIDVETTSFGSAAQMVAPLGAGQLDVGGGAPSAALFNAVGRDVNIKIVADKGRTSKGGGYQGVVVRKDLWDSGQVRSYADLKGRKVAIPSVAGITPEVMLDKAMRERANGLRARDTDLVALNFPDMPAALANKSIDAAIIIEPFLTRAVEEKFATILTRDDEVYPDHQVAVVLYSATFAKNSPDLATRFMKAYIKALRDYNDAFVKKDAGKRKEVIDTLIKHTTVKDAALYDRMVMPGIDPNGNVNVDSLIKDQDYFLESGSQKQKVDMAEVVDLSFAKAAVQQLGPYQ